MSHFGRSGPPDIRDTYSLLVLNITFRTTADDLFPLFDKYGKVVDVFIPRDRRTGDSRGFAFVRYKYQDEAQKAVEKLDGKVVDGREIMVQFAKYGPNAERIHKGRIEEPVYRARGRSRSRSPRPRDREHRRRSRSRSRGKYERERHRGRDRDSRIRSRSKSRSRSRSGSPGYRRERGRGKYDDERRRRSRSYGSVDSASPARRSPSPRRSPTPNKSSPSRGESPDVRNHKDRSPTPKSVSPRGRRDSRSPSPRSEAEATSEMFATVTVSLGCCEVIADILVDWLLLYLLIAIELMLPLLMNGFGSCVAVGCMDVLY
ncbi:Serine/arginine-rich splicing factor SC35 [Sesamum angolense]|uniref:Serine/arginine-rich splicing factor SC35 n=1 Tax=Sesamum angolense TaxID=2727404 RepID=A0AAE1W6S1_9LAMI|nr:Serine/arginine-rich splicing factor SC35 [Sesamum angolense]